MIEVMNSKTVYFFECLDELSLDNPAIKDRLFDYFCNNAEVCNYTYFDYDLDNDITESGCFQIVDDLVKLKMLLQKHDALNVDGTVTFKVFYYDRII